MDQRTLQHSAAAADRYGEIALGVECAWPQITGAPTAVQGLDSPSSSSPQRDSGVGVAFSLAAALVLGISLAAHAAPYAPQEYDFSGLPASVPGVVESVRAVPLHANPAQFVDVFEHALNAETGEELVVRLDDGRAITVRPRSQQGFRPGERVRLVGGRVLHS
jgi:hypothetical protein